MKITGRVERMYRIASRAAGILAMLLAVLHFAGRRK